MGTALAAPSPSAAARAPSRDAVVVRCELMVSLGIRPAGFVTQAGASALDGFPSRTTPPGEWGRGEPPPLRSASLVFQERFDRRAIRRRVGEGPRFELPQWGPALADHEGRRAGEAFLVDRLR